MSTPWKIAEKRKLTKLYEDKTNAELAIIFNRPVKSVGWQAWKLQLLKSPEKRKEELKKASNIAHNLGDNMRRIHSGIIQKNGNITIHRMA
jgi:hypothetical protein